MLGENWKVEHAPNRATGLIKKKKITTAKIKLIYTNIQKRKWVGSENLNGGLREMI